MSNELTQTSFGFSITPAVTSELSTEEFDLIVGKPTIVKYVLVSVLPSFFGFDHAMII